MHISQLTESFNDVLHQLKYLHHYFHIKYGKATFYQTRKKLIDKLGWSRRTIVNAKIRLVELGLIAIGRKCGPHGADMFYLDLERLEDLQREHLDQQNLPEKFKQAIMRTIKCEERELIESIKEKIRLKSPTPEPEPEIPEAVQEDTQELPLYEHPRLCPSI